MVDKVKVKQIAEEIIQIENFIHRQKHVNINESLDRMFELIRDLDQDTLFQVDAYIQSKAKFFDEDKNF